MSQKYQADTLMQLVDDIDAKGGPTLLRAKAYSIEKLREEGYSDKDIESLLNVKLSRL